MNCRMNGCMILFEILIAIVAGVAAALLLFFGLTALAIVTVAAIIIITAIILFIIAHSELDNECYSRPCPKSCCFKALVALAVATLILAVITLGISFTVNVVVAAILLGITVALFTATLITFYYTVSN